MCRLSKVIDGMVDMDKAHYNVEEGGKKYLDNLSSKERRKIMGVLNSKRYEKGEKWEKVLPQWKGLGKHRGRLDVDEVRRLGYNLKDIVIARSVGAMAKNYDIKLPNGKYAKLKEGSKITKVVVFAGKGTNKPVKVSKYLEEQYGVKASEWRKVRGEGTVIYKGEKRAELHWFECDETGIIKMKVKRWV